MKTIRKPPAKPPAPRQKLPAKNVKTPNNVAPLLPANGTPVGLANRRPGMPANGISTGIANGEPGTPANGTPVGQGNGQREMPSLHPMLALINQAYIDSFSSFAADRKNHVKTMINFHIEDFFKDIIQGFMKMLTEGVPGPEQMSADFGELYAAQLNTVQQICNGLTGAVGSPMPGTAAHCPLGTCGDVCRCHNNGFGVGVQNGYGFRGISTTVTNTGPPANSQADQVQAAEPIVANGAAEVSTAVQQPKANAPTVNGTINDGAGPSGLQNGARSRNNENGTSFSGKQAKIVLRNGNGQPEELGPNCEIQVVDTDDEDFEGFIYESPFEDEEDDNCTCPECEVRKRNKQQAITQGRTTRQGSAKRTNSTNKDRARQAPATDDNNDDTPIIKPEQTEATETIQLRVPATTSKQKQTKAPQKQCKAAAARAQMSPIKMQKVKIIRRNGTYSSVLSAPVLHDKQPNVTRINIQANTSASTAATSQVTTSAHSSQKATHVAGTKTAGHHKVTLTKAGNHRQATQAPSTSGQPRVTHFLTSLTQSSQTMVTSGVPPPGHIFVENPQTGVVSLIAQPAGQMINSMQSQPAAGNSVVQRNSVVNTLIKQNSAQRRAAEDAHRQIKDAQRRAEEAAARAVAAAAKSNQSSAAGTRAAQYRPNTDNIQVISASGHMKVINTIGYRSPPTQSNLPVASTSHVRQVPPSPDTTDTTSPTLPTSPNDNIRRSNRVKVISAKRKLQIETEPSPEPEVIPPKKRRGKSPARQPVQQPMPPPEPSPEQSVRHRRKSAQPHRVVNNMQLIEDGLLDGSLAEQFAYQASTSRGTVSMNPASTPPPELPKSRGGRGQSSASKPLIYNQNNRKRGDMSIITLALGCKVEGCNSTFNTKNDLEEHMIGSHGILPFRCWAGCSDKYFSSRITIGDHYSKKHHQQTSWTCYYCPGKTFNQYNTLYSHVRREHEPGRFKCNFPTCSDVFRFRQEVIVHIDRMHNPRRAGNVTQKRNAALPPPPPPQQQQQQQQRQSSVPIGRPSVKARHIVPPPRPTTPVRSQGRAASVTRNAIPGSRPPSAALNRQQQQALARQQSPSRPQVHIRQQALPVKARSSNDGRNVPANARPFKCLWPGCSVDSRLKWNLKYHIRTAHFNLPKTIQEQIRQNIVDHRDANTYIGLKGQRQ